MAAQGAVVLPYLVNHLEVYDVEAGAVDEVLVARFEGMEFEVKAQGLVSGLHAIVVGDDVLTGGADPRRKRGCLWGEKLGYGLS